MVDVSEGAHRLLDRGRFDEPGRRPVLHQYHGRVRPGEDRARARPDAERRRVRHVFDAVVSGRHALIAAVAALAAAVVAALAAAASAASVAAVVVFARHAHRIYSVCNGFSCFETFLNRRFP